MGTLLQIRLAKPPDSKVYMMLKGACDAPPVKVPDVAFAAEPVPVALAVLLSVNDLVGTVV
jgi:hypothetical protein